MRSLVFAFNIYVQHIVCSNIQMLFLGQRRAPYGIEKTTAYLELCNSLLLHGEDAMQIPCKQGCRTKPQATFASFK